MKLKRIMTSFVVTICMCLFLGLNVQAKDNMDYLLIKSDDQTVTNLNFETFFNKINNKNEESLIRNIITNSKANNLMLVKLNNKEEYILMIGNTNSGDNCFEDFSLYINYNFNESQSKRNLFVNNLYQNYKNLNSDDKYKLYKNLESLVNDKEIFENMNNAYLICADYMNKNSYQMSDDGIIKSTKKYFSNQINLKNNNNVMGYNLEMKEGRVRTSVYFM